jgi:hypothetical protein
MKIKKRILLIVSFLSVGLWLKLEAMDQQEDTHMQDAQSNSMEIVPVTSNTSSSNSPTKSSITNQYPIHALDLFPEEMWLLIMEAIMQRKEPNTYWQDRENKSSLVSMAKSCRYLLKLALKHYNKDLHVLVSPLILKLSCLDILTIINDTIEQKRIAKQEMIRALYPVQNYSPNNYIGPLF